MGGGWRGGWWEVGQGWWEAGGRDGGRQHLRALSPELRDRGEVICGERTAHTPPTLVNSQGQIVRPQLLLASYRAGGDIHTLPSLRHIELRAPPFTLSPSTSPVGRALLLVPPLPPTDLLGRGAPTQREPGVLLPFLASPFPSCPPLQLLIHTHPLHPSPLAQSHRSRPLESHLRRLSGFIHGHQPVRLLERVECDCDVCAHLAKPSCVQMIKLRLTRLQRATSSPYLQPEP